MNQSDTFVLVDSCVLLKPRVSDVLMDLRAERLFSLHWTEGITEEVLRNLTAKFGVSQARASARLEAMRRRCPEWRIEIGSEDRALVPNGVDSKDRHVAAGALALKRGLEVLPSDEDPLDAETPQPQARVYLVTDNVRDFAQLEMAKFGVAVVSSGVFLDRVYLSSPAATLRAVSQTAKDLRRPPYTVEELLCALAQQGATVLVAGIATSLEVSLSIS